MPFAAEMWLDVPSREGAAGEVLHVAGEFPGKLEAMAWPETFARRLPGILRSWLIKSPLADGGCDVLVVEAHGHARVFRQLERDERPSLHDQQCQGCGAAHGATSFSGRAGAAWLCAACTRIPSSVSAVVAIVLGAAAALD